QSWNRPMAPLLRRRFDESVSSGVDDWIERKRAFITFVSPILRAAGGGERPCSGYADAGLPLGAETCRARACRVAAESHPAIAARRSGQRLSTGPARQPVRPVAEPLLQSLQDQHGVA